METPPAVSLPNPPPLPGRGDLHPKGVASLQPRVGRRRPTLGKKKNRSIFNPERVAAIAHHPSCGLNPFRVVMRYKMHVHSHPVPG